MIGCDSLQGLHAQCPGVLARQPSEVVRHYAYVLVALTQVRVISSYRCPLRLSDVFFRFRVLVNFKLSFFLPARSLYGGRWLKLLSTVWTAGSRAVAWW